MRPADLIRRGVNRLGTTLTALWTLFLITAALAGELPFVFGDGSVNTETFFIVPFGYGAVAICWWIILGFLPPKEEQQ